ncbi:MAG: hypothetical protein JJ863_26610 [Deltaproteobacteria bacterium]|nr:hypothetical protein [Deltaproteobacteria bacterium]
MTFALALSSPTVAQPPELAPLARLASRSAALASPSVPSAPWIMVGSSWWLEPRALVASAVTEHRTAQDTRARCVVQMERGSGDARTLCAMADAHYGAAAQLYRQHLALSEEGPSTYEVRMNLADALFWSERYAEAAPFYTSVREDRTQRRFQTQAARMAVEALERSLGECASPRRAEPTFVGDPPRALPEPIPHRLQELRAARQAYLDLVPPALDAGLRPIYTLANARLLYEYGYWPEARMALRAILERHCSGPDGHDVGYVALDLLQVMAFRSEDRTERLALRAFEERCTFAPHSDPRPTRQELRAQCVDGRELACWELAELAQSIIWHAMNRWSAAEALASKGDPRAVGWFERVADELIEALSLDPRHPQRPVILEVAADAYVDAGRLDRALVVLGRLIRAPGFPNEPALRDRMLAAALARHGELSERVFDWSAARGSYRRALAEPRLVASTDAVVRRHLESIRSRDSSIRDALASMASAPTRP